MTSASTSSGDLDDLPLVDAHRMYIPGYIPGKLFMLGLGLAITLVGLSYLWTPLRLLTFGNSAMAEATRVLKTKPGAADQWLYDDNAIRAAEEPRDRNCYFANEFRFATEVGHDFYVVLPTWTHVKPLFPLRDADGLPSRTRVCYDARNPRKAVFPSIMNTWFIPGILTGTGVVCVVAASFLLRWAKVPIEIPVIGVSGKSEGGR